MRSAAGEPGRSREGKGTRGRTFVVVPADGVRFRGEVRRHGVLMPNCAGISPGEAIQAGCCVGRE